MKIEPPEKIDGARVLYWAWSGNSPFFIMPYSDSTGGIPIHALAICRYDSGSICRFSCDQDWEVENDSNQHPVEGAMVATSGQVRSYDGSSGRKSNTGPAASHGPRGPRGL